MTRLVFWQSIVSPHMLGLADAMARRGHTVLYATASERSDMRIAMGWPAAMETRCEIRPITSPAAAVALANQEPADVIHVVQGMRGHTILGAGLAAALRRAPRVWCMLEKTDERGITGVVRGLLYRRLFRTHAHHDLRILAIGKGTREWLIRHGGPPERIYPFAYFLPSQPEINASPPHHRLRIAFIGQLIRRKRVDLLLRALQQVAPLDYELTIIGAGPLRGRLQQQSLTLGAETSIAWTGVKPMEEVRNMLPTFDRVILPSDHDGWGAVVTEALIAGTPVICSDRCGASEAVLTTDMGAIFRHGDAEDLRRKLEAAIQTGPVPAPVRRHVQSLAHAFTVEAGANYLDALLASAEGTGSTVPPPWLTILDDAGLARRDSF